MTNFLIDKIEELAFSKVEVDDSLWESGILDSITVVEFAAEIEDEFNIKVPFDEIITDNFETISRLIVYIEKKQQENA
jgi:acyl carrier protein